MHLALGLRLAVPPKLLEAGLTGPVHLFASPPARIQGRAPRSCHHGKCPESWQLRLSMGIGQEGCAEPGAALAAVMQGHTPRHIRRGPVLAESARSSNWEQVQTWQPHTKVTGPGKSTQAEGSSQRSQPTGWCRPVPFHAHRTQELLLLIQNQVREKRLSFPAGVSGPPGEGLRKSLQTAQ